MPGINAITNEVSEGDTGALAVPVRKRGGTDRSCGASLVFGAVARGRTGAIGGAPRGGERQPRLERSADGVGAGVAEPCRGRGSRRSRPAGGGRRTVPAGAGGGRARAHSAGAAGRGATLAAAAVAHAALAACDGPVAYGVSRCRRGGAAGSRTGVHPGVERGRGGPVAGERRSSAGGSGAASGGAGYARHGRHAG